LSEWARLDHAPKIQGVMVAGEGPPGENPHFFG